MLSYTEAMSSLRGIYNTPKDEDVKDRWVFYFEYLKKTFSFEELKEFLSEPRRPEIVFMSDNICRLDRGLITSLPRFEDPAQKENTVYDISSRGNQMTQTEVQAVVEEALTSSCSLKITNMGTLRYINPSNFSIALRVEEIQFVSFGGGTIVFRFDGDFNIEVVHDVKVIN